LHEALEGGVALLEQVLDDEKRLDLDRGALLTEAPY